MGEDVSSFDPTSSSSLTASTLSVVGLFGLCLAAFTLGKERNNRNSSAYQLSWWGIPSAICAFLFSLFIFFFYD
jgi:Iap family predicted aminopeptidase